MPTHVAGHYQSTNFQFSKSGFTLNFVEKTTPPMQFARRFIVHSDEKSPIP
jgi:hypothetical protein